MNAMTQVLFVDDDELVLSCYERLLGRHFTVETALGPEQAIEALKRGSFAVVASDMRMPGMNGNDLLHKIKDTYPETVGLLLTGNPELETAETSHSDSVIFRLVGKPCATVDLVKIIEEALEQYRVNSQQATQ